MLILNLTNIRDRSTYFINHPRHIKTPLDLVAKNIR